MGNCTNNCNPCETSCDNINQLANKTANYARQAAREAANAENAATAPAGGDLTGNYPNPQIASGVIVDADISPTAAIAGSKLADGSVGDTKLATITTAGKVANSATTATSANTANAIVARNASGDFTANAITANTITTSSDITINLLRIGRGPANSATNTVMGYEALESNTTGDYNTAVGREALKANTTGDYNTAVGYVALSTQTTYENCLGLGYNSQVTGNNQNQIGNSATTTYVYGTVQNRSDLRDKADIRDTRLGLEFIEALRPVDYRWDMREDYRPEAPERPSDDATDAEKAAYEAAKAKWREDVKLANIKHDGSKKRSRYHHGLIAQEVKAVLDAKKIDFGGFQDHKIAGGDDVLSIGYDELIAPMIKAIQELSAEVTLLKSQINQ